MDTGLPSTFELLSRSEQLRTEARRLQDEAWQLIVASRNLRSVVFLTIHLLSKQKEGVQQVAASGPDRPSQELMLLMNLQQTPS